LAAACAIAGSLLGSSVLFGIARKGGEVLLARYIASPSGARLHSWFERYGLVTVFIPALSPVPLPMKIPVFCAGALEVRWPFFVGVVLAARTIRYFALAFLGLRYGQMTFSLLRTHLWLVVLLALGLAVVALLVLRIIEGPEPAIGETVNKRG
jgi:membrane protein YqaA with SNARE-associated domain